MRDSFGYYIDFNESPMPGLFGISGKLLFIPCKLMPGNMNCLSTYDILIILSQDAILFHSSGPSYAYTVSLVRWSK